MMKEEWGRRDVSSLRLHKLAFKAFDKLLWNAGQGVSPTLARDS